MRTNSPRSQTIRAWFAARKANDPLLLAAFTDKNAVFRATSDAHSITNGRDALLKAICATMTGSLDLTDVYVVGADFDSAGIAQWTKIDAAGNSVPMGSFFRVQKGLVTEWMDAQLGGSSGCDGPELRGLPEGEQRDRGFAPLPVNAISGSRWISRGAEPSDHRLLANSYSRPRTFGSGPAVFQTHSALSNARQRRSLRHNSRHFSGGEGGIRTHEPREGPPVFKTLAT